MAEKMPMEISTRIGCALVFPAAFFGTLMIADYPGPPGPVGLVEFLGWWAVCIATAYGSGWLLRQYAKPREFRLLFLALAIIAPIALGLLVWWEIQPSTPVYVKRLVEYSLQAVGLGAFAAIVVFVGWIVRNRRKSTRL